LVFESFRDDFDERFEVRQDGTSHQNGDLLHDLNARVTGLPRAFALADGLQERQKRVNAQR
jgi:hypothetical protein